MRLTPETQSQIAVPCRGALRCTKTSPRVGALSAQKGKVYTFISRTLLSSGVQKLSAETETPGGARLAPASGASHLSHARSAVSSLSHACPLTEVS